MKEEILALLLAKFAGVRKDGLAQLALMLSLQAANKEEATALVEKFSHEKVNEFVKDWRKDVDKEVSESTKTFETTLKKKYDLTEKKEPVDPSKKDPNPDDQTPAWAKGLIESNQKMTERLNNIEGEKITTSRLQQLEGKFAGVPESYKAQRIADAKLFIQSMDETAFTEYLTKTDADIVAFNQELADKGLSGSVKPRFGQINADGVSKGVSEYIANKAEGSTKTLGGKEV